MLAIFPSSSFIIGGERRTACETARDQARIRELGRKDENEIRVVHRRIEAFHVARPATRGGTRLSRAGSRPARP